MITLWSTKFSLWNFFVSCLLLSFVFNYTILANSSFTTSSSKQSKQLCHDHEKLALLQFKQSFLINCAAASDPAFAQPKTKSWGDSLSNNHSDCCTWDGVVCSNKTGHVIGIYLSNSCLYGTLPQNSTLFSLDHLQVLDLSGNNFNSSPIPSTIAHLSKLSSLNLSQSSFSGSVPSEISTLSSLSLLDLSSNVGLKIQPGVTFQKFVANLTLLTRLRLDQMDISSVVPDILSNFTSLEGLSLISCNLYGKFPVEILQLPKLEVVDLSYNNLQGYLPEFSLNSPFRYIDLSSTSFSGDIPYSIGNLGNLTYLDLSDTNVIGPIPSSLGKLTELTSLLISCNGNLPSSVTNLTKLTALHLSNLHITPRILESWLRKLNNLEKLALNDMSLYGEMPPALQT